MLFNRPALALFAAAILVVGSLQDSKAQTPTSSAAPMASASGVPANPDAVAALPVPTGPGQLLPGGTTVTVSLVEPLSSSTAQVDDQIAIVVKKPVIVNGYVYIPQGANGHATVTSAAHSAGNGSGGKLAISMDWVYAVDGGKVKLSQTNHASETGDSKGASSTATIATYLLLGPLGLFAHNFVHGRDVTIEPKQTFVVFVDHDVHLAGQLNTSPLAESTPR